MIIPAIAFGLCGADMVIRRFDKNVLAAHVFDDVLLLVVEIPTLIETSIVDTFRGMSHAIVGHRLIFIGFGCRSLRFGDHVTKLLTHLVFHLMCQLVVLEQLLKVRLLASMLLGLVIR